MKTSWIVVLACALALPAGLRAAPATNSLRYQVAVDVDASGNVTATKAASNTPAVMTTLLDHAIRQWHFHPTMRSKVPQPAHTLVDVLMNVEKLPMARVWCGCDTSTMGRAWYRALTGPLILVRKFEGIGQQS